MAIIYGNGFKPLRISHKEIAKRKGEEGAEDHALSIFLRVLTAVSFIALSFIPVFGEAAMAGEAIAATAGEAALEATGEALVEGAVETAATTTEALGEAISTSGQIVRLGQTIKGTIGLGLSEATVNAGLDYKEGVFTPLNEVLNFGLALTPLMGIRNGRKLANMRLLKKAETEIIELKELLATTTESLARKEIEEKIVQLKNIRLAKTTNMFGARMSSIDVGEIKNTTKRLVSSYGKDSPLTVKQISKDVMKELNEGGTRFTKNEVRKVVRYTTKNLNLNIKEGITVHAIVNSKHYNRTLKTMQLMDPSLATRKAWTQFAHFMTSDTNILIRNSKGELKWMAKAGKNAESKVIIGGSKINFGYYKKFGKMLSKKWRKFGKQIYKASYHKMIPVMSQWIEGYRLIETPIPGEYIMIIFFKPSKKGIIKEPIIINPISLYRVTKFATGEGYGGSVGSFYINEFAMARNGANKTFIGGLSSVLGIGLSLGELRKLASLPSAFERLIRKMSKGDYFSSFINNITETSNRLWAHKVGKIVAGRWGIATARGFQSIHKGHTVLGANKFDFRHLIEEMGVVSLDKARSVQRKAGIMGRTTIIGGRRLKNTYQRFVKLGSGGKFKYDSKIGIKFK